MSRFGNTVKAICLGAGLLCGAGEAYAFLPQDELSQREFQAGRASMLLRNGDLEQAEGMIKAFRTPKPFGTNGGYPYLASIFEGFAQAIQEAPSKDDLDALESTARQWNAAPEWSSTGPLVLADVLIARAMRERDTDGDKAHIEKLTQEAMALLTASKAATGSDPNWYTLMLRVGLLAGANDDALDTTVSEGAERFPAFAPTYLAMAEHLLIDKNTTPAQFETFTRRIEAITKPTIGRQAYARIYLHATQSLYGWQLLSKSAVVWADLKLALAELRAANPASAWLQSYSAMLACQSGDQDEAAARVKEVELQGFTPPAWIWGKSDVFEACRNWAEKRTIPKMPLQADPYTKLQTAFLLLTPDRAKMQTAAYEWSIRTSIGSDMMAALMNESYVSLERMSERWRSADARTPSGRARLSDFYKSAYEMFEPEIVGESNVQEIDAYLKAYPRSPTAITMKGTMLKHLAENARGTAHAKDTTIYQWRAFNERLQTARDFMEDHREFGARDPQWYAVMLSILHYQSVGESEFRALQSEAIAKFPAYLPLYTAGIDYFLPNWFGSKIKLDAYILDTAGKAPAGQRDQMYASLYAHASRWYFGFDLFTSSRADWPRMRDGFKSLLKSYPSNWNEGKLGYFACLAGDAQTVRAVMSTFEARGEKLEAAGYDTWDAGTVWSGCLPWAAKMVPDLKPGVLDIQANPAASGG